MYEYPFEKYKVWKLSHDLCMQVYARTALLKDQNLDTMRSMLRESAINLDMSVSEINWRGKNTRIEDIENANGKLMVFLSNAIISNDLGLLSENDYLFFRKKVDEISVILNVYKKKINSGVISD